MNTATLSTSTTESVTGLPAKLPSYLKGGAIAGILAAIVNNLWGMVSPAIVASIGFWIGVKLFKKNAPLVCCRWKVRSFPPL